MMTPGAGGKCYSYHIHHILYANEDILFTGLGGGGEKKLKYFFSPVVLYCQPSENMLFALLPGINVLWGQDLIPYFNGIKFP